jgi:ABC-2 type transport system permease protein
MSALTKSQVIAFIVAATACFLFVMSGYDIVLGSLKSWAPQALIDAISNLSVLSHYDQVSKGLLTVPSLFYFLSMIAFFLFATIVVIDNRKAS